MTHLLWFSGLTLLVIGAAVTLNAFVSGYMAQVGGGVLRFYPDDHRAAADACIIYLVKGDELTVSVDPSHPAISHNITLKKVGSDWKAEKVLEGQGAWAVKAPVRGIYVLIVEGTVLEGAPEEAELLSPIAASVKGAPRIDLLEPMLYGTIIPGLAMIVASIYLGGKRS